jgi:HAD superfamily hydrolase (TIGR01509 family)
MGRLAGVETGAIDAVTLDAMGTLVRLDAPVERLATAAGIDAEAAARGFAAEAAYYVPRSLDGRDADSLAHLRAAATGVFNAAAGADLTAEQFMTAIVLEPEAGALGAVRRLRARGLSLCVVSNWDYELPGRLASLGFELDVVTSAEAGAAKPRPRIFELALARLRVAPERTLHVGDSADDEEGARAAGLGCAPAPLEALL